MRLKEGLIPRVSAEPLTEDVRTPHTVLLPTAYCLDMFECNGDISRPVVPFTGDSARRDDHRNRTSEETPPRATLSSPEFRTPHSSRRRKKYKKLNGKGTPVFEQAVRTLDFALSVADETAYVPLGKQREALARHHKLCESHARRRSEYCENLEIAVKKSNV